MAANRWAHLALSLTLLVGVGAISACGSSSTPASSPTINTASKETFRDSIIGLPVDDAKRAVEAAGYTWRIGTIDGQPQPVTMDYRDDRLTFTVDGGVVTDASWG